MGYLHVTPLHCLLGIGQAWNGICREVNRSLRLSEKVSKPGLWDGTFYLLFSPSQILLEKNKTGPYAPRVVTPPVQYVNFHLSP